MAEQLERMISSQEVAKAVGLSVSWVRKAASSGRIPSYKIGARHQFRLSEVEAWIKTHSHGTQLALDVDGTDEPPQQATA